MNIRTGLLAIAFLFSSPIIFISLAQSKWSAAYRTGLELVNYQLNKEDFKGENYIWHNQPFLAKSMSDKFVWRPHYFTPGKITLVHLHLTS